MPAEMLLYLRVIEILNQTSRTRKEEKSIEQIVELVIMKHFYRKIGDAEDEGEVDFMIYVNQAQYEMR